MTCEVPAANSRFCAWKDSKRSLGYLRDILAPGFKDVCETVFIVALFRMRKDWKLHTCLSEDWFNKLSYSLTRDDYTSSIKKKKGCSL